MHIRNITVVIQTPAIVLGLPEAEDVGCSNLQSFSPHTPVPWTRGFHETLSESVGVYMYIFYMCDEVKFH